MRQRWRLAEVKCEDYAFVLLSRIINKLEEEVGVTRGDKLILHRRGCKSSRDARVKAQLQLCDSSTQRRRLVTQHTSTTDSNTVSLACLPSHTPRTFEHIHTHSQGGAAALLNAHDRAWAPALGALVLGLRQMGLGGWAPAEAMAIEHELAAWERQGCYQERDNALR